MVFSYFSRILGNVKRIDLQNKELKEWINMGTNDFNFYNSENDGYRGGFGDYTDPIPAGPGAPGGPEQPRKHHGFPTKAVALLLACAVVGGGAGVGGAALYRQMDRGDTVIYESERPTVEVDTVANSNGGEPMIPEQLYASNLASCVGITVSTAGKTVVFSAAMVAVALSGLFIFPQAFLKSVAYGAISAVGLAAILSITVLPSIFGMLGPNIDKWSLRRTKGSTKHWSQTLWSRIPTWAMKHSKIVTVAIVAVLLGLTLPLGGIKFGGINETYLPPSNPVRQAQQEFDETFSMRTDPVKLVVENATPQQLADVFVQANKVEGLTGRFGAKPTVDKTTVLTAGIADRKDNGKVIDQLRKIEAPEGVSLHIGGTPALEVESIEALLGKLPWMALYIVAATFILLSLIFGSVILPAKAVIMNILGLGATLGVLTLMFVDGLGSSFLGYTPGPLMSPVLVLIVAIVYGLSTDYEVFLLSRMVEARENGSDTDTAIRYGTAHTGSIITAAALIMIVVCGAFGFSEIVMMKYIAFGMIAALLLDATIIRMLLVPAVMHMLRDDCWWAPRWVKKASAALGHNDTSDGFADVPTQQLNVAELVARLENE